MRRVFAGTCLAIALVALVAPMGCQGPKETTHVKHYDVKAKVTAIDKEKKTVTLDHEAIPGYMQAMEMEFAVDDAKVLENIAVGDRVQGQLAVKSGGNVITALKTQ